MWGKQTFIFYGTTGTGNSYHRANWIGFALNVSLYAEEFLDNIGNESIRMSKLDKNNTRFLVQKGIHLDNPVNAPKLKPYQPVIKILSEEQWETIKSEILKENPPVEPTLKQLEQGSENIWIRKIL